MCLEAEIAAEVDSIEAGLAPDADFDDVPDALDNAPADANPDQLDLDMNGVADVLELSPLTDCDDNGMIDSYQVTITGIVAYLPDGTPVIGLLYDDVQFASADGTALHGWFLYARPEGTEPPPTVLFLHGNAGNADGDVSMGSQDVLSDLRARWTVHQATNDELMGPRLDAFNDLVREAGFSFIIAPPRPRRPIS